MAENDPGTRAYQKDIKPSRFVEEHLSVFVSPDRGDGWHLSISHRYRGKKGDLAPGRYPTWDEIVDARYHFLPEDLYIAQLLPPRDQYVNFHPTTFHLWSLKPEELSEEAQDRHRPGARSEPDQAASDQDPEAEQDPAAPAGATKEELT